MVKRCFICGAKQDDAENCTNANCPRYVVAPAQTVANTTTTESSEAEKSKAAEETEEKTSV